MKKEKIDTYALQVECEKLKIQNETLKFKLEAAAEEKRVVETQLRSADVRNVEKLQKENEELKQKVASLQYQIANDTRTLETETENKKIRAELDVIKAENAHLKKMLDAYRAMPDVQQMIQNMSSLAVPHIDELNAFAKTISDTKVSELCDELRKTQDMLQREVAYISRSPRVLY